MSMEVHYDFVTVSPDSDSSTPHTPSPPSSFLQVNHQKQLFNMDDNYHPDSPYYNTPSHRGSLLSELYSQDDSSDYYPDSYNNNIHQQHHPSLSALPPHLHDHAVSRRASYPSVRHDRDDNIIDYNPSFLSDSANIYCEPLPINDSPLHTLEPYNLHPHHMQQHHLPLHHNSHPPHLEDSYLSIDGMNGIKIEDGMVASPPVIVPSQHMYYPRPGSSSSSCSSNGLSPMPMYMSPHGAIPIQHTDDAASKETQYLRRRCNNCHTTEPPSWRRSTLNPGKIVCNKCGLYERTHLRPRPHRFDELRAGNKARKHSSSSQKVAAGGAANSPSSPKDKSVKKEQQDFDFEAGNLRRGSVSSSSIHSASSDYDDAVSVYSSTGSIGTPGSIGTHSSYNSPLLSSFPVPRLSPSSQSPTLPSADSPSTGGIRIPNTPLCDIASLQLQSAPGSPRKTPNGSLYYGSPALLNGNANGNGDYFGRRQSLPVDILQQQQQIQLQQRTSGGSMDSTHSMHSAHSSASSGMTVDVTGWQQQSPRMQNQADSPGSMNESDGENGPEENSKDGQGLRSTPRKAMSS